VAAASSRGLIAVIGTEATVGSDAYRDAIRRIRPGAKVIQKACPLLVPLVEEGRESSDPVVIAVLKEYLGPVLREGPDVLLLACTHYPLLENAISATAGAGVRVIDSASQVAAAVKETLSELDMRTKKTSAGEPSFYVTDNPERFRRIGERFLEAPIKDVKLLSLDELQTQEASIDSSSE